MIEYSYKFKEIKKKSLNKAISVIETFLTNRFVSIL